MYKLVLLRHGESKWNLENRFTGWTDVGLSKNGINEAKFSGKELKDKGYEFDLAYSSVLKRAKDTLRICFQEMGVKDINSILSWRLNERHYGSLQGLNKAETAKKYGEKQVLIWRRSFDTPPPLLNIEDKRNPKFDKEYSNIDSALLPLGESLKDTIERFMPIWFDNIANNILLGKKIIIVAHGNSLRALVKYLDNISDDLILNLNIPTGVPLVYELDKNLKPIKRYYLGNKKEINKKIDSALLIN